jgi:methionyl-tRNA formyltransferase
MNKGFNIVYMGTPEFAVPTLQLLHKSDHHLALVVTQPDRPYGRGRKVVPPPVKRIAVKSGLNVTQPDSVKNQNFVDRVAGLKADLFVVVAFGQILPSRLLQLPKMGTINIHASLLPKYRGPAPIQWAIMNGEKETGVTAMFMDEGLDTGDVLFSSKTRISPDDTSATLHDRLSVMGAELLMQVLKQFEAGDLQPVSQDDSQASYAPLLAKNDGHIDWEKTAVCLEAFVRGVTPWPGAFTFYGDRRLKIFKCKSVSSDSSVAPGTVIKGFADELRIATGKDALSILEIQGASGKRLLIKDFLKGCPMDPGTIFC